MKQSVLEQRIMELEDELAAFKREGKTVKAHCQWLVDHAEVCLKAAKVLIIDVDEEGGS